MSKTKIKKIFLGGTNFFSHEINRMKKEGDVISARESFLKDRKNNLDFLLHGRFNWMNKYIEPFKDIIEIGAGAGFSKFYIKKNYILSDVLDNPWIDLKIDALKMDIPDSSLDVIITSHSIHHFAKPVLFFKECERVLRPNGIILIQEINTSLMMRFLLKVMRHEGWSYDVDVYDETKIANDPADPWSANCAIPELLFQDEDSFHKKFESLEIVLNKKVEGFILPLSGGVISKINIPELPHWILKIVSMLDKFLIFIAPQIFSMGRSIVIRKQS